MAMAALGQVARLGEGWNSESSPAQGLPYPVTIGVAPGAVLWSAHEQPRRSHPQQGHRLHLLVFRFHRLAPVLPWQAVVGGERVTRIDERGRLKSRPSYGIQAPHEMEITGPRCYDRVTINRINRCDLACFAVRSR